MSKARKFTLFFVMCLVVLISTKGVAVAPIPNPVIVFIGSENYQSGAKHLTRYSFDVFNKTDFPAEMFMPAPKLPPCGKNTNSSRTWVDIYDQNGKRLNGFCAIKKPDELNQLWFAIDEDQLPPSWIYIELTDRETNTKYKSNLAETSN